MLSFSSIFVATDFRMKWKEPYVTDGLNAKMAVNTPPGVYRGFRLAQYLIANCTVQVTADTAAGDHVAVYEANTTTPVAPWYSITIRKTGGPFLLDLSAMAGGVAVTVIVTLYVTYSIGATTTAEIRAYTLAEWTALSAAQKAELIVLGTVVVPSLPLAPITDVGPDRVVPAWSRVASGAVPWVPLIRNGSFEAGKVNGTADYDADYWRLNSSDPNADYKIIDPSLLAPPHPAEQGSQVLAHNHVNVGAGASLVAHHPIGVTVRAGRALKIRFWKKALQIATSGSMAFRLSLCDTNQTSFTYLTTSIAVGAVDAAWQLVEYTHQIPAGTNYLLYEAYFYSTVLRYPSAALPGILIDDLQVWIESDALLGIPNERQRGHLQGEALVIEDISAPYTYLRSIAALLSLNNNTLSLERRDLDAAAAQINLALKGLLSLGSNMIGTDSNAALARVTAVPRSGGGTTFTLLLESKPSGQVGARLYVRGDGMLVVTVNAYWDASATKWNKDVGFTGVAARRFHLANGVCAFWLKIAGEAAAWNEGFGVPTAWSQENVNFSGTGPLSLYGTVNIAGQLYNLGLDLRGTEPNALLPRLHCVGAPTATADFTLLLEQWNGAGTQANRIYIYNLTGEQVFTSNARWDGAAWRYDAVGSSSYRVSLKSIGPDCSYCAAGVDPIVWTDNVVFDGPTNKADFWNNFQLAWTAQAPTSAADREIPRIRTRGPSSTGWALIEENDGTASGASPTSPRRRYSHWDGALMETINCRYNQADSKWYSDNSAQASYARKTQRYEGSPGAGDMFGHVFLYKPLGEAATAWTDAIDGSNWHLVFAGVDEGVIRLGGAAGTGRGNPNYNASVYPNALYSKSLPKAWGFLITTGGGGTFNAIEGFGYSATVGVIANTIGVTFKNAMSDANYAVVFGTYLTANNPHHQDASSKTVNGFYIRCWTNALGLIDPNAAATGLHFAVFGEQNSVP